jgi:hypothetical protein
MTKGTYGPLLSRAWRITRRHWVLWPFGLLASLEVGLDVEILDLDVLELDIGDLPPTVQAQIVEGVRQLGFPTLAAGLLIFGLLTVLALRLINAFGESALITLVDQRTRGHAPTFRSGWESGKRHTGRVFMIRLLTGVPFIVVLSVSLLPILVPTIQAIFEVNPGGEALGSFEFRSLLTMALPVCCLVLPVGLLASVLSTLAERTCVIEHTGSGSSLVSAWHLVKENWGDIILFSLALMGTRLAAGILLGIPLYLLIQGVFIPLIPALNTALGIPIAGVCGLVAFFWPLGIALNGVSRTYFSACWTLAHREWR